MALSGGVDSSLVAAIAVDAVGARAVRGFSMPSRYSSAGSIADAVELANRLDIEVTTLPIESAHDVFATDLPVSYTHLDVYKRQAMAGVTPVTSKAFRTGPSHEGTQRTTSILTTAVGTSPARRS